VLFCTALFYLQLKVSDPQISCNHSTSASRAMAVRKLGSTIENFIYRRREAENLSLLWRKIIAEIIMCAPLYDSGQIATAIKKVREDLICHRSCKILHNGLFS
jgi:hypothetical protein